MANFDEILNDIHNGLGVKPEDEDIAENSLGPIVVTNKRTFELPKDFNSTIGYVGDVNSQIITFSLPTTCDGHDLTKCQYKVLKWKNKASNLEGQDNLITIETSSQHLVQWQVQPEVFTKDGKLEIVISLYDIKNGKVAFSWNTSPLTQLSVGNNSYEVGTILTDIQLPAKNEILLINEETRSIVMPSGYNPVIANLGDVDTSVIFFQAPANIRGINLLDENTEVNVHIGANGSVWKEKITNISAENANIASYNSLVNLLWFPSSELTNNDDKYFGNITISISFEGNNKYWITSQLNKLKIGEAVIGSEDLIPEESGKQTIVDGNDWNEQLATRVVGGIIKLREHNELKDSAKGTGGKKIVEKIHDNELVTYYKKATIDGKDTAIYAGLLLGHENIGTQSTEQGTIPADAICIPLRGELNLHNIYLAGESKARLKGFYWSNIDIVNKTITLSTKYENFGEEKEFNVSEYWAVDDFISIEMDKRYENCSKITEINGNIITVNSLPSQTAETGDEPHIADHSIYVLEKPNSGLVDFGYYAFGFGENSFALGYGSAVFGRENIGYGYYSFVAGRENKAAYASAVFGRENDVKGQYVICAGSENKVALDWSAVFGRSNEAAAFGFAAGYTNKAGEYSFSAGHTCIATGKGAVAIGAQAKALAYGDVALGNGQTYQGAGDGYYNTAVSCGRITAGKYSFAAGNSIISMDYGFGGGEGTKVTGKWGTALGYKNTASGMASFTAGGNNSAVGYCATALGEYSQANAYLSAVIGFHAETRSYTKGEEGIQKGALAIGRYNDYDNESSLFMVGNGDNTKRHNAFEVLDNNSIKIGDTTFTEDDLKRLLRLLESIKLDGEA